MVGEETRERILDAAQRLFGTHGFAGTSLRAVTGDANVNIAAVHYHFGSKQDLLRAVVDRIVRPVVDERMARLDAAEAAAPKRTPSVEAILEAFIEPDLRVFTKLGDAGQVVTRFLGRSYTEPSEIVQTLMDEQFGRLGARTHELLCRAVPDVPPEEMRLRLTYVVGVLTYVLGDVSGAAAACPGGDPQNIDGLLASMVGFLAPALQAPATGRPARRPTRRRKT